MDSDESKRSAKRLENEGFSLAEFLVVLGITSALTAGSLGFIGTSKERIVLAVEQAKIVGLLERAKSLAFQGYLRDEAGACYGVNFDRNSGAMTVFQDKVCNGYDGSDTVIFSQTLSAGLNFDAMNSTTFEIRFRPPYLVVEGAGRIGIKNVRDLSGAPATKFVTVGPAGDVTME